MSRPKVPTIPDDKVHYYSHQLYRELSHMFEWEGLPQTVPQDYLERNLVRHGSVLYYEDEEIGQDVLRAEATGYNRHDLPVMARTFNPTTTQEVRPQITRNIKWLAQSEDVVETFDPTKDGVLIQNMAYGENCGEIVEHFAHRLALAQQAFDTNLMWANLPYIFQASSDDMRLSIEKMFSQIFSGQPFIITDKYLFTDNQDRTGLPTDIPLQGKELIDIQNEIMMKFRQTVGFNTAGVDKAERVNTLEIQSNDQHTKSVLRVMLEQREKACEAINAFFGQSVSVKVVGEEDATNTPEGGEDNGTGNGDPPGLNEDGV